MNPFDALATFVLGKIKEGVWAAWLRFLFELAFSAVVAFLFTAGASILACMAAQLDPSEALMTGLGNGMVMAALSLTFLFRREQSKLTRGMIVALPSAEATKEIVTDFQIIQKSEDLKK